MVKRLDPHQINPLDDTQATVADGDYGLEVIGGKVTGLVPAGSGGSLEVENEGASEATGVTILNFTGSGVTATDAGGGTVNVDVPGAGGSRDRMYQLGPNETLVDAFNDGSLDSAWVQVDAAGESGFVAWTEQADSEYLSLATGLGADGSAEIHGLVQPLSGIGGSMVAGDAFMTHVRLGRLGNLGVIGLVLSDGTTHGSGVQLCATLTTDAGGEIDIVHRVMANWNSQTSGTNNYSIPGAGTYLRLAKLTGTNWRVDISPDGVTWIPAGTFSVSTTPTHVGFMASTWGTATKNSAAFKFLRRVSGVT